MGALRMIKSFFKKLGARSQTGDTIIEVLISICILSVILAGSYVVANHSLQTGIDAAQRSEALALAQKQVEYIKYAANDSTAPTNLLSAYEPSTNAPFCIVGTDPLNTPIQSTPCQVGVVPYKISTSYTNPAFTITINWDAVSGHGQSQMILYYKLPGSYDAPVVKVFDVTNRTSSSVTLNGSINPNGNSYTYFFKYGTTEDFGNPPLTGGPFPFSDKTNHDVSVPVTDLSPATTYYFQLCLSDSTCVDGPSFTTYGKASLGLSASPSTINQNETTTITWTPHFVSGCTGGGGWTENTPPPSKLGGSTAFTLTSAGSYTYTISCTADDPSQSSVSNLTTVIVRPPPPTASITATPASINTGSASTLTWNSNNEATSCTATYSGPGPNNWSGNKTPGGSTSTGALNAGYHVYYLTCTGPGGTGPAAAAPVTVTTPPPPTCQYGGTYPNCNPQPTCQYGGTYPYCNTQPPLPTVSLTVNGPYYHSSGWSGTCPNGHNSYTICSAVWSATNATSCVLTSDATVLAYGYPNGSIGIVGWGAGHNEVLIVTCTGSGGSGFSSWSWR